MRSLPLETPPHIRNNWLPSPHTNQPIFIHKITHQQFLLKTWPEAPSPQIQSLLVERDHYPLPHTPKIVILPSPHPKILLLVQQTHQTLVQLVADLTPIEIVGIVHRLILTLEGLFLKYGGFRLSQKMVGGVRGDVLVWMNQCFDSVTPQNPLPLNENTQSIMVEDAVKMVHRNTPYSLASLPSTRNTTFQLYLVQLQHHLKMLRKQQRPRLSPSPKKHTRKPSHLLNIPSLKGLLPPPSLQPVVTQPQTPKSPTSPLRKVPKFVNRLKNKQRQTLPIRDSPKKQFKEAESIESSKALLYKQQLQKKEEEVSKRSQQHSRSAETPCCSSNRTTQTRFPSGQSIAQFGLQSASLEKPAQSILATFKPPMSCEKLPAAARRSEKLAPSKKALILQIKDDLNTLFSNQPSPRFPQEAAQNIEVTMELNRLITEDSP